MASDFTFAWEGANLSDDGPWHHLRVLEIRGREAISALYSFEIDLVRPHHTPDVDVTDLVGRPASLRIATKDNPPFRLVHGQIAAAEELGEVQLGTRYRVTLAPPLWRATMLKKSIIYLDKTIQQIVEQALTRTSWGAGLVPSSCQPAEDDGDESTFRPARATFAWRVIDMGRIADVAARPYCVQYQESDLDFVSRLLEEEGISYHFEHTKAECILVLIDNDGGRPRLDPARPLGPGLLGREVSDVRMGSRVRPTSVVLSDYNWRKPKLDLLASAPAGATDAAVYEHPGRYEESKETGERLAEQRAQRLAAERAWATASGACRLLGAGAMFTLEHPTSKWNGSYLVTAMEHLALERGHFAAGGGEQEPYRCRFEAVRCGQDGEEAASRFVPARITPRPRIHGSQTAIVTAEPSDPEAEINVGGPSAIGCVRVRFHWDIDVGRHEREATSCWVRVSQMFAGGRGHGAVWHPRVGDEVVVDFLEGDPDRPLITGRVYNGINLPPENATKRPTYSAIKSYTSPFDGNYNLLSFEDARGEEEIRLHAARDLTTEITRNASRTVGVDDATEVGGDQSTRVAGSQSTSAGSIAQSAGTTVGVHSGTGMTLSAGTTFVGSAGENMSLGASGNNTLTAGSHLSLGAPIIEITGEGNINVDAPWIDIKGGPKLRAGAALVEVNGGATVLINGGSSISIKGGTINVSGGTVNVTGDGTVTIKGAVVNLNS
ncbi:type VI secretion system Vgr family protein [Sorangium sp. So ce204]|uniref:type VI secretion system Vgr family protein n=1 Tax=Sorangium sp. So ce204 TaxID=3133288 RepID=UPI003F63811E